MNVTEIVIILTIFLAVVSVLIAMPIRAAYKERERLNSIDLSKEIRGWRKCECGDIDRVNDPADSFNPNCPVHGSTNKKSQTLGDA